MSSVLSSIFNYVKDCDFQRAVTCSNTGLRDVRVTALTKPLTVCSSFTTNVFVRSSVDKSFFPRLDAGMDLNVPMATLRVGAKIPTTQKPSVGDPQNYFIEGRLPNSTEPNKVQPYVGVTMGNNIAHVPTLYAGVELNF